MLYHDFQGLKLSALGFGTMRLPVLEDGSVNEPLAAGAVHPLMPWLLSFAAGAMLYVVVEELVPQAHSKAGTCGFVGGFLIMMILDVALG